MSRIKSSASSEILRGALHRMDKQVADTIQAGQCCSRPEPAKDTEQASPALEPEKAVPVPVRGTVPVGTPVLVWSTEWDGPRPGVVVNTLGGAMVNVNVHYDNTLDTNAIINGRKRGHMNTLSSVMVHMPMTDQDRAVYFEQLYLAKGRFGGEYWHVELPPAQNIAFVPIVMPN